MTRMWLGIDPVRMCPTHIKRELSELLDLVNIARGEWDPPTWVGDGSTAISKLVGHASKGQIDTRYIRERWDALWAELDRRGESLAIDRQLPEWPDVLPDFVGRAVASADANADRLASKCADCAHRLALDAGSRAVAA